MSEARYRKKYQESHTTQKGRVVYDRKEHAFGFRDAARIVFHIEGTAETEDLLHCFVILSSILETISKVILRRIFDSVADALPNEHFSIMVTVLERFIALVKQIGGGLLRALIMNVADLFPKTKPKG